MKIVQKGNKQLRVADDRLEDMRKAGYVEIDGKTGKPVAPPIKEDNSSALKKENAALKKENKALKARVEELTKQGGDQTAPPQQ